MKKILAMLLVLGGLNPQMLGAQGMVTAPVQIGVVAAVRGSVMVGTPGQVGKVISSGAPVFLGDEVKTGAQGSLQILLLDQTVFTIGPNSAMVIDRFVYDPSNNQGEVKAKILKGTFRFITGKIAHKKPSNMEVEVPSGTIGIRGTIVIGQVLPGGGTTAGLFGPGPNNNAGYPAGGFFMQSGGGTTNIDQPGFGATIPGNGQPPSGAFFISPQQFSQWMSLLQGGGGNQGGSGGGSGSGGSGGSGSGGGSATENSGQGTAGGGGFLGNVMGINEIGNNLNNDSNRNSQDQGDQNSGGSGILNGLTTYEQLRNLAASTSGAGSYQQKGAILSLAGESVGSYDIFMDIDFGTQQIGGGNSRVEGATSTDSFKFMLDEKCFASGTGVANFSYTGVTNSLTPQTGNCEGCTADVSVNFNNQNGVAANTMNHSVTVKNASSMTLGTGSGVTGARSDSPSLGGGT